MADYGKDKIVYKPLHFIKDDAKPNVNTQYFNDFCKKWEAEHKSEPRNWVVEKCYYNWGLLDDRPTTKVFSGTANEVDNWCKEHSDDPLFTDKYAFYYRVVIEA